MGAVINGKYYPDEKVRPQDKSTSVWKQGEHARQRKDHARDIVQPYKGGRVNPEFMEAFPVESREDYGFLPKKEDLQDGKN